MVNRSQADINRNADMSSARRREREYFSSNPDYRHLANRLGTEFLAKQLSKHLEQVIKQRIPGITVCFSKHSFPSISFGDRFYFCEWPVKIGAGEQQYR